MPSIFKVDTEGNCIFCRHPSSQKAFKNEFEIRTDAKQMGFKMLLRHLKVDIMEIVNKWEFVGEDPNCDDNNDNVNLAVTICDECAPMTEEVFHLFLEYERILVQLDECASKLNRVIVEGEEEKKKLNVKKVRRRRLNRKKAKDGDGRNAEVAEELRRKIVEKCSMKADCAGPSRMRSSLPSSKTTMPARTGIIKREPEENSSFNDSTGSSSDVREVGLRTLKATESVRRTATMQMESESEQKQQWECAHCGKCFSQQTARRRHILSIHPMLEFSNKIPPGITETHLNNSLLALLSKARKTRVKGRKCKIILDCPFCSLQPAESGVLRAHFLCVHWNKVIENIIEFPGNNGQVSINGEDSSSEAGTKHQCNLCGHGFPSSQSLGDHHTSKHVRNPHLCIHCGREYLHGSLTRHVKTSHPFYGFSHQIPEGVSEQDFDAALTEIVAKSRTTMCPISNYLMHECSFCKAGFRSNLDVKTHLLHDHMKEIIEKCVKDEENLGECDRQLGTYGGEGENIITMKNNTGAVSLDQYFSEESNGFLEIPMEIEDEIGNEEFEIEQKPFIQVDDPLAI